MSGFHTNLLAGLAQLLEDATLGTYNPTGAYTSGQTAIVVGHMPQTPDNVIALTAYPVDDHAALSDSLVAVQIRTRWTGEDPRLVEDLADGIFQYLHGKHDFQLSTSITVVQALRNSGLPMGQDANKRWERSDNYYLTVHRPSTNRT